MKRFVLFVCILWLSLTFRGRENYRLMTWNVENLFDCRHDTLKEDFEFLPDAVRRWTWGRYWRKQEDVARVLMAVGADEAADLVALCEVENDSVLRDLTQRTALRSLAYRYVVTDSPDRRGVDVALLYQPKRFALLGYEALRVPSKQYGLRPTRDLLHAWGVVQGGDTLHVAVCHFPSRAGQTKPADRNRLLAAQVLAALVDSLGPNRLLVVMGDFNAEPHDKVFRVLRQSGLTDLVPPTRRPPVGTYRYQGTWSWIDHVLMSPALLERWNARTDGLQLYTAPWMQDADAHGGWHPRRTYQGPAYHGGVSDHVPVYFDLAF